MDIRKCIAELLSEHDCVIIPGFGGFIGSYSPARIDPVHHSFHPPFKKLLFNINLKQNDGLLANAVADSFGTSYPDACNIIDNFAEECRQALKISKSFVITGVGTLVSGLEGNILFDQDHDINLLPDSFGFTKFVSPPVSRNTTHLVTDWSIGPVEKAHRGKKISLRSTLKWAAILALPIATAAMIGLTQFGLISSRYANNAGILSSVFSRFSSASLVVKKEAPHMVTFSGVQTKNLSPEISETTGAEVIKPPVSQDEPPVKARITDNEAGDHFAVIVGAFRMKENAFNYVAGLQEKGINATIFDQSRTGLFRVTIGTFSRREEAMQLLASARSGDFSGAWLLAK